MQESIIQRVERTNRIAPENMIPAPPIPRSAKIEITSRCNYKCSYCAVSTSARPKGDMDLDLFKKIVLELKDAGVDEVGLFLLGEPFLVKNIAEYVKYCKDIGIPYVFVTTNGSLCTPEVLTSVVDAGLDCIKFSVNAGDKQRYKLLTGVDMYDSVINKIKWLSEYKKATARSLPTLAVSSIFIPEHESELAELKRSLEGYVDAFYFMPPYNQGGQIEGFSGDIVGNPGKYDTMVPPIPCWVLFNAIKVTWDGKMTACPFDHDGYLEMADLREVTVKEAWHSSRFVALRREHLENNVQHKSCRACLRMDV